MSTEKQLRMFDALWPLRKAIDDQDLHRAHAESKRAMSFVTSSLLEDRHVRFPNLFARIEFLSRDLNLKPLHRHHLQKCRLAIKASAFDCWNLTLAHEVLTSLALLITAYTGAQAPPALGLIELPPLEQLRRPEALTAYVRAQVVARRPGAFSVRTEQDELLHFRDSDHSIFKKSLQHLEVSHDLALHHIQHFHEADGIRSVAKLIVIEPDFLIDVSSLAECFHHIARKRIASPDLYFISRYGEKEKSEALFLGNLANSFLDQMVQEEVIPPFPELFKRSFEHFPVDYLTLFPDDAALIGFMKGKAHTQYRHLKRVIEHDLARLQPPVTAAHVTLEPSFIAPKLGLQGRLDLLHIDGDHATIIELKSGKTPWPPDDPDAVGENHGTQARLYRMIIGNVLERRLKRSMVYLLYSSAEQAGTNLRFVPQIIEQEKRIIDVRNAIVARERALAFANNTTDLLALFKSISFANCGFSPDDRVPDFFKQKFSAFEDRLNKLTQVEGEYFFTFTTFIAREQWIARVGDGIRGKGHSALWNREDHSEGPGFNQLGPLKITDNQIDSTTPFIVFDTGELDLSNFDFRRGDICVLYPIDREGALPSEDRVIKCYIADEGDGDRRLTLGFRYRQRNRSFFDAHQKWAVEHDYMDQLFQSMHRELFSFVTEQTRTKKLILGEVHPSCLKAEPAPIPADEVPLEESRVELERLVSRAIAAEEYFLLVGPPGTGKTSLFLKHYVRKLHAAGSSLLLLAYTNRAVDEVCQAVQEATNDRDSFLRIGSSTSCDPLFFPNLLHRVAGHCKNRSELAEAIKRRRIVVSTVASIMNRPEIFQLKKFDRIIVDEASQVLEPMLVNILRKAPQFTLIGDDKQLPAVVQQGSASASLPGEALKKIELSDPRNSLFERLLLMARGRGYDDVWGTLTHQGRQHPLLMAFVNRRYYGSILNSAQRAHQAEEEKLEINDPCLEHRLVFIDSGEPSGLDHDKVHPQEVAIILALIRKLALHYNDPVAFAQKVGVIAPYRSQISLIKGALRTSGITGSSYITVDTVERFQGSQRDHIIYSSTVWSDYQLRFLSASQRLNAIDGTLVDRKLNVAYTRAKKQFILIGCERILDGDQEYRALIEFIRKSGTVLPIYDLIENSTSSRTKE